MGLFSSSSKQTQQVTDTSSGASVAGDATAPVSSVSINAQGSTGTFNLSDNGAIGASFDFAKGESERSFGFANSALDKATNAFNTTRDALVGAQSQALSFVTKATEPEEETARQQFIYLALGALALVGFIFYVKGNG